MLIHRKTPTGTISFTPNDPHHNSKYQPPPEVYALANRFYERTIREATGDPRVTCLIWTGPMVGGRPVFCANNKNWPARRFVYLFQHGPIAPRGRIVSLCKNPRCVNMFHVEHRTPAVITTAQFSKLTPTIRRHILVALYNDARPETVAKHFNVDPFTVREIADEVARQKAPKKLRGTKLLQARAMIERDCSPQEIVSTLYINMATVTTLIGEMNEAKRQALMQVQSGKK